MLIVGDLVMLAGAIVLAAVRPAGAAEPADDAVVAAPSR
jgi:hypothetical protein